MKNKQNLLLVSIVLSLAVLGCSSMMKGKGAAGPAVEKFHKQFNDKKFAEIYAESGEKLKKITSEEEMNDFLDGVYTKLGTFKSSKETKWNVNTTPDGTLVTMNYDTEFSEEKGAEEFVFELDGDKAILVGYHVTSNALITK